MRDGRRCGRLLQKTSRLLTAHEAVVPFGIGAEIAATVAREGFRDLDAPIERIGAVATPPPYAPGFERAWLPDRDDMPTGCAASSRSERSPATRGRRHEWCFLLCATTMPSSAS
jgi:pyruvate/2-oxoglutarate/acetoin dehydrogenase E1 component